MKDQKETEAEEQIKRLSEFAENLSILNPHEMLETAVKEVPHLINSKGASIYLRPELVPQYDGSTLIDENLHLVAIPAIQQDFIVLAATSYPEVRKLIGKAFYTPDDGLCGWVFKYGRPLRLRDSSDEQELRAIHPALHWINRYKGSKYYYNEGGLKSLLIVPLLGRKGKIGILKIPAAMDREPFTATSEAIAVIIAQVIAKTLDTFLPMQEIFHLMELGTKEKPREIFEAVTQSAKSMLECSRCQLYLSYNGGGIVKLAVENGRIIPSNSTKIYARGKDTIGWVFKTGKPLLIDDLHAYSTGQVLDDTQLMRISDGVPIDDQDRYVQYEQFLNGSHEARPLPFLAVPVISRAGSIFGVLCASCLENANNRFAPTFNRNDLQLMQSFASTISLAIQNYRERMLGYLLIKMGQTWDLMQLFKLVVDYIPKLVPGTGCSIFTLKRDAYTTQLQLVISSRKGLSNGNDDLSEIIYKTGIGKTGFCALARSTLVVNHYGSGEVTRQHMQTELQRIESRSPGDFVTPLCDQEGREVGIIQLKGGLKAAPKVQKEFQRFSQCFRIQEKVGLPSPKQSLYQQLGSQPSWSFVAVPIRSENGNLYGVITVGRPIPQNPFLSSEVSLLESISGRLAAILHTLEMEEHRKQLHTSLAHEINTPLQGILADTENLVYELQGTPELQQLSKHNLDQVLLLHLQTETIMAVLTEQTPAREFSVHSIYRPLKAACQMFESEAAAKGCDILEPQSIRSRFPNIEMSLFDLELALKNLIHNAVKYSFYTSRDQDDTNRYVKITGSWADAEHAHYSIHIQNYGVGISPEEIEQRRIFEPYYRGENASDRHRTGAGLGLAHARQIVENLHHGSIEVTSKHLSGQAYLTTFTVTLPITQPCQDC